MTILRLSGGYTDTLVVDLPAVDPDTTLALALTPTLDQPPAESPLWRAAGTGSVASVQYGSTQPLGDFYAWAKLTTNGGSSVQPVTDPQGRAVVVSVV